MFRSYFKQGIKESLTTFHVVAIKLETSGCGLEAFARTRLFVINSNFANFRLRLYVMAFNEHLNHIYKRCKAIPSSFDKRQLGYPQIFTMLAT